MVCRNARYISYQLHWLLEDVMTYNAHLLYPSPLQQLRDFGMSEHRVHQQLASQF